jgi:hypothetical protein
MPDEPPVVPTSDQIHASAVRYLLQSGCKIAPRILLSCESSFTINGTHAEVTLRAPDKYYTYLWVGEINRERIARGDKEDERDWGDKEEPESVLEGIERAFAQLLPGEISTVTVHPKRALLKVNPDWRQEFGNVVYRVNVDNQGITLSKDKPLYVWHNLRFRSQTEMRIAEALERVRKPRVLYLPNCIARLGFKTRKNLEADFLICRSGKWGILEVDGPFHSASRKADEDARSRAFRAHGILVVEHYDSGECWENAQGVVQGFLHLLAQA